MKFKAVAIVSLIVLLIPFILYFSVFNSHLSLDAQDWANFGSFIGGIVSSFFSFLSFLMVLIIFYETKKEKNLDEVEDRVFKYIDLMNSSYNKLKVDVGGKATIGESIFYGFNGNIYAAFNGVGGTKAPDDLKAIIMQTSFYQNSITEYLKLVKNTIKFIDKHGANRKEDFVSFVLSQLSEQQRISFAILMYKDLDSLELFKESAYRGVPLDGYILLGKKLADYRIENFDSTN